MLETVKKYLDGNYSWIESRLDQVNIEYGEPNDAEIEFSLRFAEIINEAFKSSDNIDTGLRDAIVQIKDELQLHKFDQFEPLRVTIYSSNVAKADTRKKLIAAVGERLLIINTLIKILLPYFYLESKAQALSKDVKYWVTHLTQTYGVSVEIVDTNEEFEKAETIERGERENIFFISEEDPEGTARTTQHLLKRRAIRNEMLLGQPQSSIKTEVDFQERSRLLIELANRKRLNQSIKAANEAKGKIAEIIKTYRDEHGGQEPRVSMIAEILTRQRFPTPGKAKKWYSETVKRVIEKGDFNEDMQHR